MKAATTLITLTIVVAIVVSVGLMIWLYLSGFFSEVSRTGEVRTEESLKTLSSCMKIEEASKNKFFIRNCGNGVITNDTLNVYIDDELFDFDLEPSSIEGKKAGAIVLHGVGDMSEGQHSLKIINPNTEALTNFEAEILESLVLDLNFDEGSGNIAFDSSEYGNDGTITEAVWTRIYEEGKSWDLALVDGFDDGDWTSPLWNVGGFNGDRQVVNKELRVYMTAGTGNSYAQKTFEENSQFIAELNVTPQFALNYYIYLQYGASSELWIKHDTTELELEYVPDSGVAPSKAYPFTVGREYNLKIVATNSKISLYVDGNEELTHARINQVNFDAIRLETWSNTGAGDVHYDDVKVYVPKKIGVAKSGSALYFDGTDDYVTVPRSESLNITGNRITVESWIKFNNVFVEQDIMSKSFGTRGYYLWLDDYIPGVEWDLRFMVYNDSEDAMSAVDQTTNLEEGKWYHVLGNINKTHIKIFVDGKEMDSSPWFGSIHPFDAGDFNIGYYNSYFNGTIDSVRIFDDSLSPDETIKFRII
ncbi:MAG: hypothetical protein GTN36_02375 [Candidatus Aenigmarchaeota archaeon]|nr:hypothetical protein [Candidatus Aenigmarchaeota archaeon]